MEKATKQFFKAEPSPTSNVDDLAEDFKDLNVNPKKIEFTREMLVDGLKNQKFKKVVFLTGAGISVSAGIPDFRTPGTGLHSKLADYNVENPNQLFDLAFFKKSPEPFYKVTKEILKVKVSPVISHHFIRLFADEGLLYYSFTQNIDGLEVAAGVDPQLVVEAHGNYRSVHCIDCKKEGLKEEFMKHLEAEIIYKCECGGLYKPDIVFFGEAIPRRFFDCARLIINADLVIVMGTSLKVVPFATLALIVPKMIPLVYVNRENEMIKRENFLFLEGDIDLQVGQLIKDLGWEKKLEQFQAPKVESSMEEISS